MTVEAYVLVVTKFGEERKVASHLANFDSVLDVDGLYGEYDIIAKLKGSDLKDIENFIYTKMRTHPGIERTQTLIVNEVPID